MNRHICLASIAAAVLLVTACSGQGAAESVSKDGDHAPPSSGGSDSTPTPEGLSLVSLPVPEGTDVDGLVRVNGHDLAVHCRGSGHPTAVLLHGWIDDPGITSYNFYGNEYLVDQLEPDVRVCTYDRVNVGDSETVAGTQTPEMVVGDLDGLMEAIGEDGPYVLVGQSQGGMVASAYAVAHPDKVGGIVMVDAAFDEVITLDNVLSKGEGACDPVNRRLDGEESLQKIDNCAMYEWAYERRDLRPEVPLIYLAAKQAPWSDEIWFGPRYTKLIIPLQKSYVASWSPGRFVWVDSDHDIQLNKPDAVPDAVRWVIEEGS